MFATGVSIGCVASVKWVGLFAIALVGLNTIEDLWDMLGDLKMSKRVYAKHWMARIVNLIVVPISIYMFSFWLHFLILNESGPGDAQMSSLFQAGLQGNSFDKNPLEIAYGSTVSIKNTGHGGGLLHSHVQRFPTGSEQQQVTCYHHKDSNNEWIIQKPWPDASKPDSIKSTTGDFNDDRTVEFVNDGDIVRLAHKSTSRNLHSHNVKAPITVKENEVSCYGNETWGDRNDHWKIEISGGSAKRIRSLSTQFRLRHVRQNCLLRSHSVSLPQWGFKQAEVVCQKKAEKWSKNNIWNIELHVNDKLPPAGSNVYKSSFFKDFVDLNVAMWTSNNALTPDPDKEPDALVSQPYQWPILQVGLRMASWNNDAVKYFLIGHPVIWWASTASVGLYMLVLSFYLVQNKRKVVMFSPEAWDNFLFAGKVGVGGWALHYFPFWIMGRVCYLHHYFPALYFAIIVLSHLLDHTFARIFANSRGLHYGSLGAILVGITAVFFYFGQFAFGFTGDSERFNSRRWLSTWKF